MRFAGLAQWLEWQERLHPRAIDLGLERVRRVLLRTGWQSPRAPVLTVGGTNGKGSCVALAEGMLRAAGLRVATFTSPHLVDYRERIRVDGVLASEASIVAAFERIADALHGDTLTFFEFNTLAALLVFETAAPDAVVLEVGMGGRLDAVNVVDADAAIVASVGLDHMEWLGPDVETIAREKAGIFRPGRPAVFGGTRPPAALVDVATSVGARLLVRQRDFAVTELGPRHWSFRGRHGVLEGLPRPALEGDVQVANAATVLAALESLGPRLAPGREAIERGLREVRLPGRFQRIAGASGVEWLLDVGHNADAARTLADMLAARPAEGRTIAVLGMLADKDVAAVVGALRDRVDHWLGAGTPGARGLSDTELAARAARAGVTLQPAGTVEEAMARASALARPADRIVCLGSFHTVGPALEWLRAAGLPVAGGNAGRD